MYSSPYASTKGLEETERAETTIKEEGKAGRKWRPSILHFVRLLSNQQQQKHQGRAALDLGSGFERDMKSPPNRDENDDITSLALPRSPIQNSVVGVGLTAFRRSFEGDNTRQQRRAVEGTDMAESLRKFTSNHGGGEAILKGVGERWQAEQKAAKQKAEKAGARALEARRKYEAQRYPNLKQEIAYQAFRYNVEKMQEERDVAHKRRMNIKNVGDVNHGMRELMRTHFPPLPPFSAKVNDDIRAMYRRATILKAVRERGSTSPEGAARALKSGSPEDHVRARKTVAARRRAQVQEQKRALVPERPQRPAHRWRGKRMSRKRSD